MKKLLLLFLFCLPIFAGHQTATPSGGDISTPLQTAINSASNGDTIFIPACTTAWVNTVTLSNKWVFVWCQQGVNHNILTDDTTGGRHTGYPAIQVYDSLGQPFHFKGLNFVFTVENIFWIDGSSKSWHVDSCVFNYDGPILSERHAFSLGNIGVGDTVYTAGLVNQCTMINCGAVAYAGNSGYQVWRDPLHMGTFYTTIFENDSVIYNQGYSQCWDQDYGGQGVWRYCVIINTTLESHSVQGITGV